MSFVPSENDLLINPITHKPSIGKNIDSYEVNPVVIKSKQLYKEYDQFYNRLKYYSKINGRKHPEINSRSKSLSSNMHILICLYECNYR